MTVRGWCPGLHTPMPSGDGWLVRVKPPTPALDAATLRALADAASRHGSGTIELTSRGHLQIRGLRPDSVEAFAEAMLALGLASADRTVEQRRSLTVSPLAGLDPGCDGATLAMTRRLAAMLEQAGALDGLPGKFHFAVDGGGALPLAGLACDVLLRAGGGAWHVGCEGGPAVRRDLTDAAAAAQSLARVCADRASRLKPALAQLGADKVFALAGLGAPAPMPPAAPGCAIGRLPGAFGLGLRFGRFDARHLADLAARFGDGTLRLTPWRCVLLPGVADPAALTRATDLIATPADPLGRIIACPGAPGCASAAADIRADAARLAPLVPASGVLHLSGCAKGCAHPGPAALTLVATRAGYDLVRDGRAGDAPLATGLDVTALLEHVS
jgi:precorrin-3B synthase